MGKLLTNPGELTGEVRQRVIELLREMLDIELNKVQTQKVYGLFPTTDENKEAARERGFQGIRIEEISALLGALKEETKPQIQKSMTTLHGVGLRPAFFCTELETWNEFLIFRYLRDRARACWAIGLLGTDYVPLAVAVSRTFMHTALNESRPLVYTRWSDVQLRRIRALVESGHGSELQSSIDKHYWLAKPIIAAPNEQRDLALGVRSRLSAGLVDLFVQTVHRELSSVGLTIPDAAPVERSKASGEFYLNAADGVPDWYREKLVKLLKMHLSSEYTTAFMEQLEPPTGGDWAEWMMTIREEGEHGEGIVQILDDFGVDAQSVVWDMRFGAGTHLLDFFKVDIEGWDEVGVMRWLSERAAGYQSLAALGSNYLPFAIWSARNYMDEGMAHAAIGRDIVVRALKEGRKAEIQRLMLKRYPYVLDYFGNEKPSNDFVEMGLKTRPNRELRRRWIADSERDCRELGLTMPTDPLAGVRAHYSATQEAA